MFQLLGTDPESKARRGRLTTAHGEIETPAFMPVGTQGTVKAISPDELTEELDAQIILGNTYHLHLRPGLEVIREFGGLHPFMRWDRPILTDSGGYQVFSLAKLRKITREGVKFQNHLNGATMMLTPELSMEIQATLGSDIAMYFDECPPYPCEREYAKKSLDLTNHWALRCKAWTEANAPKEQLHFGIVQGSIYADLREASAKALVDLDLDGYAVGGVSVGEPEEEMFRAVDNAEPFLPAEKPRYAMGLGTPPQLVEMIGRGIDMFDCVLPTRLARHGTALTNQGPINLKNERFKKDTRPIEENSDSYPCRKGFSRAYLRHLLKANEILGLRLISLHNLHFYLSLARRAREALDASCFTRFRQGFISEYYKSDPSK
ncbi:tRNA guanosine(34) transglycosylase Tgt [Verrucomicrobiales bacterium]|nr:tRNA guanosine(34) transglycosylase Tgt [Verrucomicrobiales bacterium]MDC0312840.1 tRNA guanosine(34) transglycosylase Tgt [Verrucomicrobiales bacterium]MDC0504266.1 tRNA guanosine(34) transglycosylase Tgt [Verrucomicrobiales bacterium]MDF1784821.1 tRNA guanosine(34) transglycosylase Tgt [Verrucomicrobiales bacterium]